MRAAFFAVATLLCVAAGSFSAPPVDIPATVTGEVGDFIDVRAKTDGKVVKFVVVDPGLKQFPSDLLSDKKAAVFTAAKPGKYRVLVYSALTDDPTEPAIVTVVVNGPPAPPVPPGPTPPGPGPTPDPSPKPVDPLTSFRVFLIYESKDTLTNAQRSVIYGEEVENWVTANCTGGANGWRRRDKDSAGEADPTLAPLWNAIKPKITVTPCVAIERNGQVTLVNTESTPANMIAVLSKYRDGK